MWTHSPKKEETLKTHLAWDWWCADVGAINLWRFFSHISVSMYMCLYMSIYIYISSGGVLFSYDATTALVRPYERNRTFHHEWPEFLGFVSPYRPSCLSATREDEDVAATLIGRQKNSIGCCLLPLLQPGRKLKSTILFKILPRHVVFFFFVV